MEIGILSKQKYEEWRFGKIPYLEQACICNLRQFSTVIGLLYGYANEKVLSDISKKSRAYLEELRQELQREYQVLDDVMQNEAGGVTIFRLPLQDWYRNLLPPGSRKY